MAGEVVRTLVNHVWTALEPLGYPCALIGGAALAAWHHPRATRDVDLLIAVEGGDFGAVAERLVAVECRPKRNPPLVTLGTLRFAQFLYTPPGESYDAQIYLWLVETDLQKSAMNRRVHRDIAGFSRPIDVLNCDDLILFKLVAGRMIDRADAATLLRENLEALDLEYMQVWIARLKLQREFSETWTGAFPGRELPDAFRQ